MQLCSFPPSLPSFLLPVLLSYTNPNLSCSSPKHTRARSCLCHVPLCFDTKLRALRTKFCSRNLSLQPWLSSFNTQPVCSQPGALAQRPPRLSLVPGPDRPMSLTFGVPLLSPGSLLHLHNPPPGAQITLSPPQSPRLSQCHRPVPPQPRSHPTLTRLWLWGTARGAPQTPRSQSSTKAQRHVLSATSPQQRKRLRSD